MDLSNIRIKTKNRKSKRVGRGVGSGRGKTSGRGHKGAGQRKGKTLPYTGFRGGNLPLIRTFPKRGFNPHRRKEYQEVNLSDIQKKIKSTKEVTPEILKKMNIIKDEKKPVKILAKTAGDFTKKCVFKADKFSSRARELIETAGGSIECLNR